jgi:hypothetical protein
MPIDYSKWDHLEGDSESSEDDGNITAPQVTRLDSATRVTFGGQQQNGWSTSLGPTPTATARKCTAQSTNSQSQPANDVQSNTSSATSSLNQWTANGGSCVTSDERNLFWSQDRYSVHIRLELQPEEAVKAVHVDGILPYSDRHCATGSHKHHLKITGIKTPLLETPSTSTPPFTLLQGDLPHPVHWAEEDDGEAKSIDWDIERHPLDCQRRFASITLYKAVPMNGLFVWWKRPLMQFDLPVTVTAEQNDTHMGISGPSNEFLNAWEEAHRIFRETKRPQVTGHPK